MKSVALIACAGLALSGVLSVPQAVAQPTGCTWQVSAIESPDGHDAHLMSITGTDSHGSYSGYMRTGQDLTFILWTNGKAEVQPQPPDVGILRPVDENAAGTVLLRASTLDFQDSFALTYRGGHTGAGVYEALPMPPGYERAEPSAINDRGDAVGSARRTSDGAQVAILWSVLAAGPIVIEPPELDAPSGMDVDEDGTILLTNGYAMLLWRNGEIIPLRHPTPVIGGALRGGTAVGTDLAGPRGFLWHTRMGVVGYLEGSGTAEDINAHGLIAGSLNTWNGPAAVWQGTRLLARLPLPPRAESATASLVGDDGVIFGSANPGVGPVRWLCVNN